MNTNLIIQYSLVILLIAGALGWTAYRTFGKRKKSGCGCCSLSQVCQEKQGKPRIKPKEPTGQQADGSERTCCEHPQPKSCCVPQKRHGHNTGDDIDAAE